MFYGTKPDGATYYAREGKFEFIAWAPPPETGDRACLGITGKTESQLVQAILNGEHDRLLNGRG